jgi:glycerol kinase
MLKRGSTTGWRGFTEMPKYILALDQGTTSSRSILFDVAGSAVATAQREFPQYFPQSGWVEHEPREIWTSQAETIAGVLASARATPADIAAVGITNQRETTLLWDRKSGEPVARAIVWQDRRTAADCERLRASGVEPEVTRRTGLLLDPYFSGTKLTWLLDNVPGARSRAERGELCFGTVDSWLVWQLTHGKAHVTDATNASRTLLFNIHTGEWDAELLRILRVPRECLPTVIASSGGDAVPGSAAAAGRPAGAAIRAAPGRAAVAPGVQSLAANIHGREVPLAGIAGDQQAALFGQTCFTPGMAKNTYGTGCFLLMNTGTQPLASKHRLLTTVAWQREQLHYALEGSVFVGGAVIQWLRDGLGIIQRSSDVEALAASVADAGGVCFVPAFTGLGSPHWDPHVRGTIVGLSRGSTRAHIARAALESIAFQSADLLTAMQSDASQPLLELRVDGGATNNNLLMQFQADILGVPVIRPRITETTALGAAFLAGLAVGFWRSTDELSRIWQVDRRFEPSMTRDQAQQRLHEWSRAIATSKAHPA